MLPYVFIASGIIGYILWYFFARIQKFLAFRNLLISGYFFLLISILFLFFMAESSGNKWWYFSMFVWMRFFTFLNAVMFGGIFARIFNMQKGKRLFALISAGDVVSQMLGYFSIPLLLKSAGVSTLLWISISGIFLQLLLILFLNRYYKSKFDPHVPKTTINAIQEQPKDNNTRTYYLLMFCVSLLPMLGFYYVDYMFLNELKLEYTSGQAVAGFLGLFLGAVAVVELITRLFISGRLLTIYGLKFGINILPITLLFSTLVIVFFALMPGFTGLVFSMIAFSKLLERVLRFSFNEPAYQIFYQPVPQEQRFSLRTKMEGVPKALGVIIAGLLILFFNSLGFKESLYLNLLFLVVLAGWLFITKASYKSYCLMLEQFVKRKFTLLNTGKNLNSLNTRVKKEDALIRCVHVTEWNSYKEMTDSILKTSNDKSVNEKRCAEFSLQSMLPSNYFIQWFDKDSMIIQLLKTKFQSAENLGNQLRILDLIAVVKTEEGFIKQQLVSKNPLICQMAVKCLQKQQICIDENEKVACKTWLEEMMGNQLWYYVVLDDLGDDQSFYELRSGLDQENHRLTNLVFDVLAFIYEPAAVAEIREGVIGITGSDGKILAHELLENFFDPQIREKITGLYLEEETDAKIQVLHDFYPQQRLSAEDRLLDIIRKEYQLVPIYLKLLALEAICKRNDPFKEQILLECLQNIHPLLAATALAKLRQDFPESCQKAYDKLPASQQKNIELLEQDMRIRLDKMINSSLTISIPAAILPDLSSHFISTSDEAADVSCSILLTNISLVDSFNYIHKDAEQKVYVFNTTSDNFTSEGIIGFTSNLALCLFS